MKTAPPQALSSVVFDLAFWAADFSTHPLDNDLARSARTGASRQNVRTARRRLGIAPLSASGRPRTPGTVVLAGGVRLLGDEPAMLDALCVVTGKSQNDALRQLVRNARTILPGGGRDARAKFDEALASARAAREER